MRHVIIKYPQVFTDINFISILTLPIELLAAKYCKRKSFGKVEYGADISSVSDNNFRDK